MPAGSPPAVTPLSVLLSRLWLLLLLCWSTAVTASNSTSPAALQPAYNATSHGSGPNRRQKRLIAYNYDEQRITFPPGTVFFITPTLNVPFIRNLKKGFESKLTISAPFQMIFDDFGITDEYNPWGIVPGLSVPQGRQKARRRKQRYRRTVDDYNPHPLGDRVTLFQVIEQYLTNLGHNGPACLLRAICELNRSSLPYHGLFGEFLQMVFRVSTSPYADEVLPEYLRAELSGRESGVCDHYYDECPSSLLATVRENRRRIPSNINEITQKMKKTFDENQPSGV